jgi:hypothetical protein
MDWSILLPRIGVSLVMIIFGIDQIRNSYDWEKEYVPKWLKGKMPMPLHGFGNLLLGLWLLSGFYLVTALWTVFIWWITILPFAFYGSWKAGLRDLAIITSIASLLIRL